MLPNNRDGAGHAAFDHKILHACNAHVGDVSLDPKHFEKNGEVVIVECKASNNRATSMKYVIANPKKYGKHVAVKFADANIGATKIKAPN